MQYLIKDKPYIAFTYMTGILPIAKQLFHSTINYYFNEFSMIKDVFYYKYFNFHRKRSSWSLWSHITITYEDLDNWYNGYKGPNGEKIFNTWSVCQALSNNKIKNCLNSTRRSDELINIVNFDITGVKNEILELVREEKLSQGTNIWSRRTTKRIWKKWKEKWRWNERGIIFKNGYF